MRELAKFRGIFVALNTIYDKQDNISADAMQQLVDIYKKKGVQGVYLCGSTGEGLLLSAEERMKTAQAVKEAAGDDFTVIIHVGCASTKESILLAEHAARIGADAVSAVPCIYYRLPPAGVEQHWTGIINATDLPFIIYNIPQLTGFQLPLDLFQKMAGHPKVIGIKNSEEPVFNMERFRTLAGKDFVIYNGADEQYLAGRMMGADAGIGGTYGVMPELFAALERHIQNGRLEEAKTLQYQINEIIFKMLSYPSLYGAAKRLIQLRFGIETGQPRSPLLPVCEDETLRALAAQIDALAQNNG